MPHDVRGGLGRNLAVPPPSRHDSATAATTFSPSNPCASNAGSRSTPTDSTCTSSSASRVRANDSSTA